MISKRISTFATNLKPSEVATRDVGSRRGDNGQTTLFHTKENLMQHDSFHVCHLNIRDIIIPIRY
jgi:hypothetical protein